MSSERFQVGFGEVNITPEGSVPLAGYYYKRLSTGVHDPLHARALAVSDGTNRVVLCVADLVSVAADLVKETRRLVTDRTALPDDHLIIAAIHTHTGPGLREDSPYRAALPGMFSEAIVQALEHLVPCDLSVGWSEAPDIAFCRRYRMKDGSVRTNPGVLNPDVEAPLGTPDPAVMALLASVEGRPEAALLHFALHCDTVGGTEISADWTYYVRETLRQDLGPALPVITPIGPAGDINHWNVFKEVASRGFEETKRIGAAIGRAGLQALSNAERVAFGPVRAARRTLDVSIRVPTDSELAEARKVMKRKPPEGVDFTMNRVEAGRRIRAAELGPVATIEITAFACGDVAFVGVPCELFTDLGRDIKARSPFRHTIVVTLADGPIGYVGSRRAMSEGGYEMTSSPLAPGGGELIVDTAADVLASLAEPNPIS